MIPDSATQNYAGLTAQYIHMSDWNENRMQNPLKLMS